MKNEVVLKDNMDRRAWDKISDKSQALKNIYADNVAHKEFLADIHTALLKPSPIVKPPNEINPTKLPAKTILEEMLKTSDYNNLHCFTKNDATGAAIGVLSLASPLLLELSKFEDTGMEAALEKLNELNDLKPEQINKINELNQILQTKEKHLKDKLFQNKDAIRRFTRKACKYAQSQVQQIKESINAMGSEPDKPASIDLAKSIEIAKMLTYSPKLQRIALLAGRMKTLALNKRASKVNNAPAEVVDIEFGADLTRILPSELALIGTDFEQHFLKKYTEKTVMQYQLEGKECKGKGAIIVCMDESGSMAGRKEIWAKGYFLGLQALASKDKRDLAYIPFGTTVGQVGVYKNGLIEPVLLCNFLSNFLGHGGTNFDEPLRKSIEVLDNMPSADIVFITDGKADVANNIKEGILEQKEKGLHLYVVLIEENNADSFTGIADIIITISPSEDGEAIELYENL